MGGTAAQREIIEEFLRPGGAISRTHRRMNQVTTHTPAARVQIVMRQPGIRSVPSHSDNDELQCVEA